MCGLLFTSIKIFVQVYGCSYSINRNLFYKTQQVKLVYTLCYYKDLLLTSTP